MEAPRKAKPLPAVGSGVIDPVRMRMLHAVDLLKAHSLPAAEHSSDKSSQDRLSQLDAKTGGCGMDWSAEAAPVSSKLQAMLPGAQVAPAAPAPEPQQESATRTSPRRAKLQPERERSCDSSKRAGGSCTTDPAARLTQGRLQEALSRKRGGPAGAEQALAAVAGETPAARQLASSMAADVQQKRARAAQLIAVAQRLATEAARAAKRRRVSHKAAPRPAPAGSALLGARVAVFWPDANTSFKGTVAAEDGEQRQQKLAYDDETSSWLALAGERFRLLSPRAASAGCTARLVAELRALGAEQLAPQPAPAPGRAAALPRAPQPAGEAAVGWRVSLLCCADGQQHAAQIIGYKRGSGRHHLLYLDGEDEWAVLAEEALTWHERSRAPLHAGAAPPSGAAAVGWRLAVYWRTEQRFYCGSVQAFSPGVGRHHVLYGDGDEEHLRLAGESIKWLAPPAGGAGRRPPRAATARAAQQAKAHSPEAPADARRGAQPASGSPKQARGSGGRFLSRHGSRGSGAKRNGSMESVSAMLQRVDADEAALMSQSEGLQPPARLFAPAPPPPPPLASPLGSLREGGASTGVSPQPPPPLLPFQPAAAAADEPPQGWGPDAKLLGWNLVGGSSPLRSRCRPALPAPKPEPLPAFPAAEPARLGASFLNTPCASEGLPAAPLEAVLPPTFSGDGGLLLQEPTPAGLPAPLVEAAESPADLGSGDLEMDLLLDIPGVEAAPTAWWQSM